MATATSNKGLGRGFDSLIPADFDDQILSDANDRIHVVPIETIDPHSEQPRRHFDQAALQELAKSIERYGVLQPLVVTKKGDRYTIIAGERRWRASRIAKLKKLPVIVRSHKELEQLEIALIENVQRVDLSPLEQAASIQRLHDQFSLSYGEIAERLGKATPTINNTVRLMQLPKEAQEALKETKITEGHARSILALKGTPDRQKELLDNILRYGWSVRQAEQFVVSLRDTTITTRAAQQKMATKTERTKELETLLSSPVTIKHTARGGRLEVHFESDDDLNRVLDIFLKFKNEKS